MSTGPRGIEGLIHDELLAFLREHDRATEALSTRDALMDELGLSSSELVQLLARISSRLQAAEHGRVTAITDIRTVGDLYEAYRRAATGSPGQTDDDALERSRRRAEVRRGGRRG